GIGQVGEEAKATARRLHRDYYSSQSGTVSVVFDMANGGKVLQGLSDPAKMEALMSDAAYVDMAKSAAEASGMAEAKVEPKRRAAYAAMPKSAAEASGMGEAKVEPKALVHRDVPVMRTTMIYDDPQMSPLGEDDMESYVAVAGDLLITTMMAGAKAEVQALID